MVPFGATTNTATSQSTIANTPSFGFGSPTTTNQLTFMADKTAINSKSSQVGINDASTITTISSTSLMQPNIIHTPSVFNKKSIEPPKAS